MSKPVVFEIVIPTSGKAYKFSEDVRSESLIDFPNGIILGLRQYSPSMNCYIPDKDNIYHYAGDLNFNNNNNNYSIHFHSRAISSVGINSEVIPISKRNDSICDIKVGLDIDKSTAWFENLDKQF
ncbi:hypothetical protein ACWE42_16695 [Sutcliffiella cohnii]